MAAIDFAEDFYDATKVVGVSVPATEHSVMCMGTKESEIETFRRLISDLYPSGIVSIVSDSGDKKSAAGLLRVEKTADGFELFDRQSAEQEALGALETVFEDGKLVKAVSFEAIRARLTV